MVRLHPVWCLLVSYRRNNARGRAGRLYDRLVARFGRDAVFKDVDSIRRDENPVAVIRATIARLDTVFAVIRPR